MLLTPSAFAAMLLAAVPPTELATLAVPNGASGDEGVAQSARAASVF
jgi:hypothetical protein